VLQADTRANGQTNAMIDVWKQWEGQVADGRFHLRQYLGGSERGPVFLTEYGEPEPQQDAIKLFPADPQNADAQLARWARASSQPHPHLLRIFHTGRCQVGGARMVYAVMERADEDLSQILPVRTLTPMEAREMLRPVLEALAYLHGKALVHGNIKPSNIMAVGEELKISSDGICAVRETTIGRGKPTVYDAPEAGTRGGSAAADVWSLGVTLVEVLTRKLPSWEWKGQEEPELPRLPAPFGDIAKQCLRRDPQQRCTLADIAARLDPDAPPLGKQQPVAAKAVAAAPPPPPRRPESSVRPAPVAKAVTSTAKKADVRGKEFPWRFAVQGAAVVIALVIVATLVFKFSNRGPAADTDTNVKSVVATQPAAKRKVAESKSTAEKYVAKNPEPPHAAAVAPSIASAPPPAIAPTPTPAPKLAVKKVAVGGVGGAVAHQLVPAVPQSASSTIRGTVRVAVRAQVDSNGKVIGTSLESAGPSKYFAKLAEKAARNWEFVPPTADGQATSSAWIVRFEFAQDGTKATAAPATP
jgi:TonB family protein